MKPACSFHPEAMSGSDIIGPAHQSATGPQLKGLAE